MRAIPFRYSIRNLLRRPARTGLTVLGLSLIVALIVFLSAFGRSVASTVRVTGHPRNLVVVSKKAQSMELSSIPPFELDLMANDVAGSLVTTPEGTPLFSREVFRFEQARFGDDGEKVRAKIFGVRPELAPHVLAGFRLVEGEMPEQGNNELLVGTHVAEDLGVPASRLAIGSRIAIGEDSYRVSGRFEAPGSLVEHWLVAHAEELKLSVRRRDYSFARFQVKPGIDLDALAKRLSLDERYQARVLRETEYFADFAAGFSNLQRFAVLLALILGAGGILTGMNTMHNAISGRIREIGVLRVLGYGKASVTLAFLVEVLLLCAAAGALGCVVGWLADGLPMRLPFAAAFPVHVDAFSLGAGLLAALLMGVLGLVFPLSRALGKPAVEAVRAVA